MGYKYLCNKLYEHLLPDEIKPQILFLDDGEFGDPSFDLSETEAAIGQPYLMRRPLLDRMPKLKWIQCTGSGCDAADLGEIKRRGIQLTNSRGVMSRSIAEDVIFKMLFFARKCREVERNKTDHKWNTFGQDQWMCRCYADLYGKTLGILGYGSIGREIAKRARAFGMRIIALGRGGRGDSQLDAYYDGMGELYTILGQSDFVSVNLPLTDETRRLFNDAAFERMKKNSILINVARGAIVDEEALYRALRGGKIAGAACDVFEHEPLPEESPLWDLDNIFITSHKAGMGDTWTAFIGELITRNIERWRRGEPLENAVNL